MATAATLPTILGQKAQHGNPFLPAAPKAAAEVTDGGQAFFVANPGRIVGYTLNSTGCL
jgi:hypothetical protein